MFLHTPLVTSPLRKLWLGPVRPAWRSSLCLQAEPQLGVDSWTSGRYVCFFLEDWLPLLHEPLEEVCKKCVL